MPLDKPSSPPKHDLPREGQPPTDLEDTWVTQLRSPKDTQVLGKAIGHHLIGGEILALTGQLGAGKTLLTKGIASGLGIPPDQVTSPTFTFIHEYTGPLRLIHADLYRINSIIEVRTIGLEDYYDPSTTVVIEWADRMGPDFEQDYLLVHLAHMQRYIRLATLKAFGPLSRGLLEKVRTEMTR